MSESPFVLAGERLRDNDVSAITIMPGKKAPGVVSYDIWRLEHNWSRFCDRLPTKIEMDHWAKWEHAGVGAALGASSAPAGMVLVAIDLDSEDPAVAAAVYAVIPQSPVKKRGLKGHTGFYLAPASVKSRSYNDSHKHRMLDLLAHGRQTVLPPTIHPDCPHCGTRGTVGTDMMCTECGAEGATYKWLTLDTLESFDISDLPVLGEDVADRIGEALLPWGYEPAPSMEPGERGSATLDGSNPHRSLNDAALANLDAWIPELQLHGCYRTGDGKYKAVAHWRPSSSGRHLHHRATNLAISPQGIKDAGEQKGYTPLDLVMASCGIDLDLAFRWLQERVAPVTPVVLNLSRPKEEPAPAAPAQAPVDLTNVVSISGGNLAGLMADLPAVVEPPAPPAVVLPVEHCQPAGLLGETAEWIGLTAATPLPQHNLAAAIALLGAIMGRRWESPTRARTNFYIMALAGSGFGKEHPQEAAVALAEFCALDNLVAAEEVKSDSAIRKMLERKPHTAVMFMDEFGGFVKKILDRRAASHERKMRDMLLSLFSKAKSSYKGAESAAERAVPIQNPHLVIYGASTPSDMWRAFDSASGEDGLLARFLVFDAGPERPVWRSPPLDITQAPPELRKRIMALMDVRPAGSGNLSGVVGKVQPIRAEWGDEAQAWWETYRDEYQKIGDDTVGVRGPIYNRAAEHVMKLALVMAVGCNAHRPVITVSALEWARAVVECSMECMFAAMENRVADSERQAEYLWVKRYIQAGGRWGVGAAALKKAINGRFDKRRTDDIIGQLLDAHEIESINGSGPKGGAPSMRYRMKAAVEEAA